MVEIIVGLALLPAAIIVGIFLLGIGAVAIWFAGGWIMALVGVLLLVKGAGIGGVICLVLGLMWGVYSAVLALE